MARPLTASIRKEIEGIVGPEGLIGPEGEIGPYTHDMTEDFRFPVDLVVRPKTPDEVAGVLRIANREGIPVTPRSAGTSLSGGALPVHGGIVLSVERMNRILEIDEPNLCGVVEPGVITQVFQEAVEKVGLYYPPDPASRGSCMIGGNVAHNAGGPHAVKYGVTRDWVLGLETVLADGRIIRTGGKLIKNVTGYNLTHLFVGSEGTLGIFTKIILRLIPHPPYRKALLAAFPDLVSAGKAVAGFFAAKIIPAACEFIERGAMDLVEELSGRRWPVRGGEAALLIEADGVRPELIDEDVERLGEICEVNGAEVVLAEDASRVRELWELRRSVSEAIRRHSRYREQDVAVPRASVPELLKAVRDVCQAAGLGSLSFGHIGDGNVHVKILRGNLSEPEWEEKIERCTRLMFERVVSMGGTITGEHGVGYVQRNYLPMALSGDVIGIMRDLKKLLDPKGILNPGKVFPEEP